MAQDRIEQGLQVARGCVGILRSESQPPGAVENLEVEMVVFRRKGQEEVVDLLLDLGRPGIGPVDLVDQDDGSLAALERLLQDEPRLRQWSLGRVHEKQHALDHGQDALDFRAEVPVSRRVHDVDDRVSILDGRVLRQDRDAAFALELARVHHQLGDVLARAEGPALLQAARRRGSSCRDRRAPRSRAPGDPRALGLRRPCRRKKESWFHSYCFRFPAMGQMNSGKPAKCQRNSRTPGRSRLPIPE